MIYFCNNVIDIQYDVLLILFCIVKGNIFTKMVNIMSSKLEMQEDIHFISCDSLQKSVENEKIDTDKDKLQYGVKQEMTRTWKQKSCIL